MCICNHSSAYAVCSEVPLMLTQSVHGDIHGGWDTLPGFVQNSSIFQLTFEGSMISNEQYTDTMDGFRKRMKALSLKAAKVR